MMAGHEQQRGAVMRFAATIVVAALALSAVGTGQSQTPPLPSREAFHLFLLAGQSNMAGRGKVEPSDWLPSPGVLMLDRQGAWVPAVDPMHFDKPVAGVGLGRAFAGRVRDVHPAVTVGLIPVAAGGSPIDTWRPGGYHDQTRSHPWDDAIARARIAMQAGRLAAILWHQGESDSTPQLAPGYEAKLHDLIARFRAELGAPDLPFIVGQLGQFPDAPWDDARRTVDAAHRALPGKVRRTAFVSSDGLTHGGDKVHFDSPSLRELGRRYAAAYETLASQTPAASADERLRALYTEEWTWRQREFGRRGDQPGESGASDHLPRVDAASQQARLARWTNALAALDAIPFEQLTPDERENAEVFRASIRALANDVRFRLYEAPFNSDTFFWTSLTPRQGFATATAYRAYLGRLRDVPRYFDEQVANMRAGLARGFTVPRVSVIGRDATIEPYVKGDDSNPLYGPFTQMPASLPAADQAALRAEAATVIREVVAPAYARLLAFMRDEYLPGARTSVGASALPDGEAYYQAMIEKFTTLPLTAKEIHAIGLKEVARIRAEMEATKQQANFAGTMEEFFGFLRTDPRFYARTPRELLAYSAYVAKKADWKLDETIGVLPRRRHGIRPVPEALAPIYTGGRGGLDACLMNTYNLPARPLYTLAALTLHECTPGHSFQAALALEGPTRPPFRRGTSFSSFGEGWGLYTEWLGTVMGIYETPYEDFGRLTYEMWRACRLVIDTGLHQFGWTREQAMDYLRSNAALSEHEITTEVERYIAWPGQALAYKLGELQIRRHRREAEAALGPKFDQRHFHDAILALGSVPLPVLERRIAKFIADGGVNPDPVPTATAPVATPSSR